MGETDYTDMPRDAHGRFLPGVPAGGNVVRTTADARNLARRRWDKAAAASRAALLAAVNESGVLPSPRNTPVEAWGTLVGHAAELAMTTDNARGVADLTRMVGQATQYLPTAADARAEQAVPAGSVVVPAPVVAAILDRLSILLDVTPRDE